LIIRVNVTFEGQDRDNWEIRILRRAIPVVSVEHPTTLTQYVDTQLFYKKSKGSYMVQLRKADTVRPYVSDNVNKTGNVRIM